MEKSGKQAKALGLRSLRNRYFAMRHGESEANVLGVAVGDPERGVEGFGLTDTGRQQVVEAAKAFKEAHSGSVNQIELIASDFRRTRETAEVLAEALGISIPVRLNEGLRERLFGELEGWKHEDLAALVERKGMETVVGRYGCETAESVFSRLVRVLRGLEEEHEGRTLILVSHADPIQFLMAALARIGASEYERIVPMNCAEIAELSLGMTVQFKENRTG